MQAVVTRNKNKETSLQLLLPYLSKVPDVEEVKGFEQLASLHAEDLVARRQEGPDVLQAQELRWERQKTFIG